MIKLKESCVLLTCVLLLMAGSAAADEGMWVYTSVPKDKLKARYGFDATQKWLDHVRMSSVKFPGGSGSVVSSDGLLMTNHHIGAGCIHAISTAKNDYMKTGFYARTQAEEVKCPNMSVSVLEGVEDITSKLNAAVKDGAPAGEAEKARSAATATLENECRKATKLNCQAVSFYSGATYFLYKYKSYNDVRLVFAPEYDMAFFGGDPDNFEFPRYALDVTFLRLYEDGKPVRAQHYFKWSKNGARKDELVFVSGHPGSTARLSTMAQLEFLRDVEYPAQIDRQTRNVENLLRRGAVSEEERRNVERQLFSAQNSLKATKGYYAGLVDKPLMAAKAEDENKLRDAVLSNSKLKAEFGDPWKDVADYYQALRQNDLFLSRSFFPMPSAGQGQRGGGARGGARDATSSTAAIRGSLADLGRLLIRAVSEKAKPEAERSAQLRDMAGVEKRLFAAESINKANEVGTLAAALAEMNRFLPQHPILLKALNGKSPQEAARDLIENTQLSSAEFRKQLYTDGKTAIEKNSDRLVALLVAAEQEAARVNEEYRKSVTPLETRRRNAEVRLAKARFAVEGLKYPPDANSTLRLSYGAVKGYVEDGLGIVPKGTRLEPFTTIGEAFTYAQKHESKEPYKLPESWTKAEKRVKGKTPLNFVSTNDIIGGNSGSPVVNRKAEVVGLIFDGNIQMLPGRFMYGEAMNRSISVDSRGIVEALRDVYDARALADELQGKRPSR